MSTGTQEVNGGNSPPMADRLTPFRDRLRLMLRVEALVAALGGLAALWLLLVVLHALHLPAGVLQALALTGILAGALALAWRYHRYPQSSLDRRPAKLAAVVADRAGHKDTRAVIAADLATQDFSDAPTQTAALADLAVRQGMEVLSRTDPGRVFDGSALRMPLLRLALFGGIALCVTGLWPQTSLGLLHALARSPFQDGLSSQEMAFMVGDITVTYVYPAHTGREPVTIPGTSGDLEAVKGTRVTLDIRTDKPYDEARIVMDSGLSVAMTSPGPAAFRGEVIIEQDTAYHFVLDGATDAAAHAIKALKDQEPSVRIVSPPAELEIRDTDTVTVTYEASDDFGLGKVSLVFEYDAGSQGRATRTLPVADAGGGASTGGSYQWDLATLTLAPGDRVVYRVEATDNDTIDGPKTGRSASHVLKVYSVREHHEKVLAAQQRLFEHLLSSLADMLEAPLPQRAAEGEKPLRSQIVDLFSRDTQAIQSTLEQVTAITADMAEDPMTPEYIVAVFTQMQEAYTDLVAESRQQPVSRWMTDMGEEDRKKEAAQEAPAWWLSMSAQFEQRLVERREQDIVSLFDLINKQRYDRMVSMGEEIKRRQEELASLFEQYKNTGDKALKERLSAQIEALKERIGELSQELSKLLDTLPEGFVNRDALEQQSSLNPLEQMAQKLKDDDLEGAMKELENLARNLEQMLSNLKEGSGAMGERMYNENFTKMANMLGDLEQLEQRQGMLSKRADDLAQEVARKKREAMEKAMKEHLDELRQEIAAFKGITDRFKPGDDPLSMRYTEQRIAGIRRSAEDMRALLKERDLATIREVAQKAIGENESLSREFAFEAGRNPANLRRNQETSRQAGKSLERIMDLLDQTMPGDESFLSPQQLKELERMSGTQRELERDLSQTGSALDEMMQQMAGMPNEAGQMMQQAMQEMNGASHHMGQGNATGGSQQARNAHQSLKSLNQGLRQAMQAMKSGMGYGGMRPMGPGGRQRGGQGGGVATDKVNLPSTDSYQVPSELRDDLLKTMKEASPEQYKQQNKSYYEGLIK